MILQYLLALTDYNVSSPRMPRSPAAVKRRQSLMIMNATDTDDDRLNPSLFNLVDLVLGSTSSHNAQTVSSALKLTTVILSKNHGYALGSLVKIMHAHHKEPLRTVGSLNIELETYLNLAIDIAGEDGVDEAYDTHLKDVQSMLESHPCSLKTIALPEVSLKSKNYFDSNESSEREVDSHYLLPEDPLFRTLNDLLLRFLTNDIETNLALTETIICLGSCAQLRLEGWLSVDPADYQFDDLGEEPSDYSNENFRDMLMASRLPNWNDSACPQMLACLQQLQAQVETLRTDITDWDDHVANRKASFKFHEEMHDAMKMSTPQQQPSQSTSEPPAGSWTPQIPKHVLDSSATPSRTQSPRGRKEALTEQRSTPNASPAPSKLGGQTLVGSPSRTSSPLPAPHVSQRQTTLALDIDANFANLRQSAFHKRRIRFRRPAGSQEVEVMLSKYQPPPKDDVDDTTAGAEKEGEQDDVREASLLHIITNVVILQEFILELVALMQIRASLFNEIRHA